ncbi:Crp/Fnr family transcriptional regulator [Kiloniella antarctica]|uniref:Crp/Fnr family transcriptional regulator n=1 Tax=Kiloniella antarctica TaxID=1550907 RepID=A0ABW5BNM8_9PROT
MDNWSKGSVCFEHGFSLMRNAIEGYCQLSEQTWSELKNITSSKSYTRGTSFVKAGEVTTSFGFVCSGLFRAFVFDLDGNEYCKNFFIENSFPGSMVALLSKKPSDFSIQSLEDSHLLEIDFGAYRELLKLHEDLKWFHILYLEKNWILDKEKREVALVQDNATERYLTFQRLNPGLEERLSQYHVASHIGVTPTQLSRIRKALRSA